MFGMFEGCIKQKLNLVRLVIAQKAWQTRNLDAKIFTSCSPFQIGWFITAASNFDD